VCLQQEDEPLPREVSGLIIDSTLTEEEGICLPSGSLLWGTQGGKGERTDVFSPASGERIAYASQLSEEELVALTAPVSVLAPLTAQKIADFAARLHRALLSMRPDLREAMQLETAFISEDCEELLEGSLAYVEGYCCQSGQADNMQTVPILYRQGAQTRQIRSLRTPWGTIVVILPQNAFLLLGIVCLLNALAAGNRVILRAPMQSARSAALLAKAIQIAQPPQNSVSLVMIRAKELLFALYKSPTACLIHYMGSSRHAPQILSDTFQYGKAALIDGEGNGWVWVGADACPETAAKLLIAGALRYNGQTCTSINGAVIHPALYSNVRDLLIRHWEKLKAGCPLSTPVDVGPLFDVAQAQWCEQQIGSSGGLVLCGGQRKANLLSPTLIENPNPNSALVTEGLFGPALWIAPGDAETFVESWRSNRFPLCAGILSPSADPGWWHARLQNLARLVMNGDISQEYLFEPWGGYPSSGMNVVGDWKEKYQRVVQTDEPFFCEQSSGYQLPFETYEAATQ